MNAMKFSNSSRKRLLKKSVAGFALSPLFLMMQPAYADCTPDSSGTLICSGTSSWPFSGNQNNPANISVVQGKLAMDNNSTTISSSQGYYIAAGLGKGVNAEIAINNSTLKSDGGLYIGAEGGTGLADIKNSTIDLYGVSVGSLFSGTQGDSSGNVVISGANSNVNVGLLSVGVNGNLPGAANANQNSSSNGSVTVSDGAKLTAKQFQLGVGPHSVGTLNIDSGTFTLSNTASDAVQIGWVNGKANINILNGGVFNTNDVALNTASNTSRINFDNGVLNVLSDSSKTNQSIKIAMQATGRATINTDGNVSLENTFTGPGSLEKNGSGTLTLAGSGLWTGGTVLNDGQIIVSGQQALPQNAPLEINNGRFNLNNFNTTVSALSGNGGTLALGDSGSLAIEQNTDTHFKGTLDGQGTVSKSGTGVLTLDGDSPALNANVLVNGGGLEVNGDLSSSSLMVGSGATLGGTGKVGNTQLNSGAQMVVGPIAKSGSEAQPAVFTTGNLTNNGAVIIGQSGVPAGSQLHVAGDYIGNNGTLALNTALGNDNSATDKLVVDGKASGSTDVQVNNLGGKGDKTINGIEIVQVGGGSTNAFHNGKQIRAGLYDYTVVQKGKNYYLTSDYVPPDNGGTGGTGGTNTGGNGGTSTGGNGDTNTGGNGGTSTGGNGGTSTGGNGGTGTGGNSGTGTGGNGHAVKNITPAAGGYIANLAAANTLFNLSLADREGETEYVNPVTGEKEITSLWLRQEGGHNRFESGPLKTRANRYVAQIGGELAHGTITGIDRWDAGLMAGYANQQGHSSSHLSGYHAKSQIHGYSTGLYATWYQNAQQKTGAYVDTWAQYNWFTNSVSDSAAPSDSYRSKGVTASVESGYAFKVAEGQRSAVYLVPQAQLTWMDVRADSHRDGTGSRVRGDGEGNLQSHLGVRAYLKGHSERDDKTGRSFKPYVEANWLHNTERYGVKMDNASLHQDGAKNIAELKTGVEGQLTSNLNVWGGVGVQVGDKSYSDTSAQIGVKYSFR